MTSPTTIDPPPVDATGLPTGWRGPILPINTVSGDSGDVRRVMVLDTAAAEPPVRPLPVAFQGQELSGDGHDGARVIGVITRAWIEDNHVWAEGPFDLGDPHAVEWARKLHEGFAGWVSVDLTDAQVTEVPLGPDGEPITADDYAQWEQQLQEWIDGGEDGPPPEPPEVTITRMEVTDWKIGGATLVGIPAFESARVAPVYDQVFDLGGVTALEALVAAAEADAEQTGAMIALVPADTDPLVIDGGEPAEELHLTLAYLGEGADWSPEARETLITAIGDIAGGSVEGSVFGHASFNPTGEHACAVYLVDALEAVQLYAATLDVLAATAGIPAIPDQHSAYVPHITAGYGLDVGALSYTGPVTFDRIRIAFAGEVVDIPLDTQALAASAGVMYKAADFFVPEPDEYVDHWQVTADGRVSMHLGEWGQCHIGYGGECVTIPAGVNGYSRFHRIPVDTDDGPIKVGKVTMGTGHAADHLSAAATARHYDDTGTLVAVVRCVDGKFGPWLSGHLVPWATKEQAQQLAHHEVSGDWRGPHRASLELVAALAVNVPGFMRSTVSASGAALVAAGRRYRRPTRPVRIEYSREDIRTEVRTAMAEFHAQREFDQRAEPLDRRVHAARLDRLDRRAGYRGKRYTV